MGVIKQIKTKLDKLPFLHIVLALVTCLSVLILIFISSGLLNRHRRAGITGLPDLRLLSPSAQQSAVAKIIKSGDLSKCAAARGIIIGGINYETICRDNIATELAISHLDPAYCAQISDRVGSARRQCLEAVLFGQMRKEKDIKVCEQSNDPELVKTCQALYWQEQAIAGRDLKQCDSLDNEAKQNCRDRALLTLLINNKQCDPSSTPEAKQNCRNLGLPALLINNMKVNCYEFSKPLQSDCLAFQKITAAKQPNISACNSLSVDELVMACRNQRGATPKK